MHVINMGHDGSRQTTNCRKNRKALTNMEYSQLRMGAIGQKDHLIEEAIRQLKEKYRIAVIAGDVMQRWMLPASEKLGVPTIPVNTGKECHLDAKLVEKP
jgi:hydrogenase nickel incorporation protein HypB